MTHGRALGLRKYEGKCLSYRLYSVEWEGEHLPTCVERPAEYHFHCGPSCVAFP